MKQQLSFLTHRTNYLTPWIYLINKHQQKHHYRGAILILCFLLLPFLGKSYFSNFGLNATANITTSQTYKAIDFSDGTSSINGASTSPASTTDYVTTIGGAPCPIAGDFINGYDILGGQSRLTFTFNTPVDLKVSNFIYLDYYYFNDVQNNSDLSRYLAAQNIVFFTSAGNLTGSVTFTNTIDSTLNAQQWVKFRVEVPYTATNTITITGIRVDIEMNNGGTGSTFNASSSEVFALSFEGIGANAPLPIELMNFDAKLEGNNAAQLNWATASELNNAGFEIEHALPTTAIPDFNQIAYVNGAGTTEQAQYYNYEVSNLVAGVHYFRLKQVDYDGTSEYSSIRAVRVETPLVQQLFPTIISEEYPTLYIQLAQKGSYQVKLLTPLGELLEAYEFDVPTSTYYELDIDATRYATGIYLVQVSNGLSSYTQKISLE